MTTSATELCRVIGARRGNAVVVVTMTSMLEMFDLGAGEGLLSCVPLMGGAASLGLGLALARPERSVVVLDGDASLLMQLGSLATVADAAPPRLVHVVLHNGVQFEGFANLPIPARGQVSFAALAAAAGYRRALRVEDAAVLDGQWDDLTSGGGPTLVEVMVDPAPARVLEGTFAHFEIPAAQFTRMGEEMRRLAAYLGSTIFGSRR